MQQHGVKYLALKYNLDPGVGSKGQNIFFLKEVILHIKLKEMRHRAPSLLSNASECALSGNVRPKRKHD